MKKMKAKAGGKKGKTAKAPLTKVERTERLQRAYESGSEDNADLSDVLSELNAIQDNAEKMMVAAPARKTIQTLSELKKPSFTNQYSGDENNFAQKASKFSIVKRDVTVPGKDVFTLSSTQDGIQFVNLLSIESGTLGSALDPRTDYKLDFSGMEQITDCVLDMFATGNVDYKRVKAIDLTGCIHITDAGIISVVEAFSDLTAVSFLGEVKLNGCHRLTSRSLQHLHKHCSSLKTIEMRATNVDMHAVDTTRVTLDLRGCPLISPLNKPNSSSKAPSSAMESLNHYKVCIVRDDDYSDSLVGYLTKANPSQLSLLYSPLDMPKKSVYHLTETNSALLPLFMSDRCIYIFTFAFNANLRKIAPQIASKILEISSKVECPQFLLVGLETNKASSTTGEVVTRIKEFIKGCVDVMSLQRNSALKDRSFMNFHDQLFVGSLAMSTINRVKDIAERISSVDIRLSSKENVANLQEKLGECVERLRKSFSEYHAIPTKLLQGLSALPELIGKSVLLRQEAIDVLRKSKLFPKSEYTTSQLHKVLRLAHITGNLVTMTTEADEVYVTTPLCFLQLYQSLLSIENATMDSLKFLASTAKTNTAENLTKVIASIVPKAQVSVVLDMFVEIGVIQRIQSDIFVEHSTLSDEPHVPLEMLWPPSASKNEQEVTMKYNTSYFLSNAFIQQLIASLLALSKHRQLLWKRGILIQDGFIDVLFRVLHQEAGTSQMVIVFRTVNAENFLKIERQEALKTKVNEMLWRVVEKYILTVDYNLYKHALFSLGQMELKTQDKEPAGVTGYIPGHKMAAERGVSRCAYCGIEGTQQRTLWKMWSFFNPSAINSPDGGNICKLDSESETVTFTTDLNPFENSSAAITLIDGQIDAATLNIQSPSVHLELDFSAGKMRSNARTATDLADAKLSIGDYIRVAVMSVATSSSASSKTKTNDNSAVDNMRIMVYKNADVVFTDNIVNKMEKWKIFLTNVKKPLSCQMNVSENLHSNHLTEPQPGMRLEAKDRLNPTFICVATIQEVSESGQLLIHFDGWTSRYDYWAERTSNDLHPLGFFDHISQNEHPYLKDLQAPHGYRKSFNWADYLNEEKAYPLPYGFFTEEQLQGTPPDLELACLAALDHTRVSSACIYYRTTPEYIEKQVRDFFVDLNDPKSKTAEFQTIWQSQNTVNKFFLLMPESFSADRMWHPSRNMVTDVKGQRAHFLCSGQDYEIFHVMDSPGSTFDSESVDLPDLIPALRYVILTLFSQESIMPEKASNFCKGVENVDRKMAEKCLRQWLAMYAMFFEIISPWKQHSLKHGIQAFTGLIKDKSVSQSPVVRCDAHEHAISTAKNLTDIPLERFTNIAHFLFKLDVQNNQIKRLPDNMAELLPNLYHLDVSSNELLKLPNSVCDMKYLTWLDISSNQIIVLPDNFVNLADKLTYLSISDNPFVKWPVDVLKCANIIEFYAKNVGHVTSLEGIGQWKNLQCLELSGNILCQFPSEMTNLQSLTTLQLAGIIWLTNVDGVTSNLHADEFYKFLDRHNVLKLLSSAERKTLFESCDTAGAGFLNATQISDLNRKLFEMYPRFGSSHEMSKKTKCFEGGFPKFIVSLTNLEKLDLSFHALKSIPSEITQLTNLKSLRLWHNPDLETIAAEVGSINLTEMYLKGCTSLKTPPKEIIERGFRTLHGYLKRLQMGSVACRRTKLMLVGLGGAGKTSLIRALTHKNYYGSGVGASSEYQDEFYEMMTEKITDGIDITKWIVPVEGNDLEFSVWDFAGQTVYYNTHQFFLSSRAVYLLLWNIRLGYEHAGLDFWLSSIACHAPGTPILIVGTHCDKVETSKMPAEQLKKRYPQIKGFHTVSSYSLKGIPELQNALIETTLAEKYMGEQIPHAWLTMESNVKSRDKGPGSEVMAWSEVELMGGESGILDPIELTQAVQFLHDLGSVQFFNTEFLKSYVVIHPQWIVDVMACVVSVHERYIQDGRFLHADMKKIWGNYPEHLHPWLLRLTEEFDLTFPLKDERANLVPCLLPDKEPKYKWPDVTKEKDKRQTKMVYSFQYLPAGLFNRVQVRLHQFSDSAVIWKRGSLLNKNDHLALIKQTGDCELEVKVQGTRPENVLFMIHEVLEHLITESFHGVHYDLAIPCIDCSAAFILDPCMFTASKVHRAVELKAPFLQCDRLFHTLSIPELQASMPPDRYSDFDLHLGRSVRDLQDLRETISISVFLSYCDKNVPSAGEEMTQVHPRHIITDLEKSGMLVRHTRNLPDEKLSDLTLQLKTSNVIVVCISSEYVANQNCCDFVHFVVNTLRKSVLLVQLGSNKDWLKSKVGLLFTKNVYVNMQDISAYNTQIKELIKKIRDRSKCLTAKSKEVPRCFISYAWSNSELAVKTGNVHAGEGSLGWGDPRELKDFLVKNGVPCWMDVEQVGSVGLYEDIAEGLKHAKVMVACVSDEYAASRNCQMEYRYALMTLKIPTVLAVVGTGYTWLKSEIGMLSVGNDCPQINFQYENASAHLDLLKLVQTHLPTECNGNGENDNGKKEQEVAFQEVLELAQRKFLRQVISYANTTETAAHPRLIVLDLWREANSKQNELDRKSSACEQRNEAPSQPEVTTTESKAAATLNPVDTSHSHLAFTLLCEYDQGWHDVSPSIAIPGMSRAEESQFLSSTASYTARMLSVLRHSGLNLAALSLPEGDAFRKTIEEYLITEWPPSGQMCVKSDPRFNEAYHIIVAKASSLDPDMSKGRLKRCQLPNGKVSWLCDKHAQLLTHHISASIATTTPPPTNVKLNSGKKIVSKEAEKRDTGASETNQNQSATAAEGGHETTKRETARPLPRPLKRQMTTSRACRVM